MQVCGHSPTRTPRVTMTMLVATMAERAARQHVASVGWMSLVALGTSCKSPAVGSMAPRRGDGNLEASRKQREKGGQSWGRFSFPKQGSSLCRRDSHQQRPRRRGLHAKHKNGFNMIAGWVGTRGIPTGPLLGRACMSFRHLL